ARQLALCTVVGALTGDADVMRAADGVREAQREWDDLARQVPPREDVATRFAATCDAILEEAASLARRVAATEHPGVAVGEDLGVRRGVCERVAGRPGADALGELRAARAEWSRLSPVADEPGGALSQRFAEACEACAARHRDWLAEESRHAGLEGVI